eukprot:g9407.t2
MLQDSQELHAEARAQAQVVVHDGDEAEVDGHVKLKERVKEIRETNRYRLTLSGPMVLALLYLAVNNCGVKPFLLGDLLRAAADGWLRPLICRIETLHADQYILYSNQSRPVQKPIVFPEVAVCLDELEARQFPCVRLAPQQLLRRFGENIGRAEQDVMLVANFVCRIAIDLEMWPKCSYEDKMDLMIVLLTSPSSVLFAELVALVSVLAAVWILERKVPNAKRKRRKSPKAQKEEKEEGMEKETNGRQNDAKKERNAQKDTKVGKDEDKKDKTKQKMKEQKNDAEKAKVVKKAKAKEAKAKVEIKEEAHEAEEHGSNTHLAAPVCAPKAGHEAPHEAVRPRPCAGPFMRTVQDLMHRGFQPLETSEATGEATGEATADFEDPEDFDPENPWIHWRREGIWSASDLRAVHQHYSASLQFQPWNLLRLRVLAEQGTWFCVTTCAAWRTCDAHAHVSQPMTGIERKATGRALAKSWTLCLLIAVFPLSVSSSSLRQRRSIGLYQASPDAAPSAGASSASSSSNSTSSSANATNSKTSSSSSNTSSLDNIIQNGLVDNKISTLYWAEVDRAISAAGLVTPKPHSVNDLGPTPTPDPYSAILGVSKTDSSSSSDRYANYELVTPPPPFPETKPSPKVSVLPYQMALGAEILYGMSEKVTPQPLPAQEQVDASFASQCPMVMLSNEVFITPGHAV